MRRCECSKSRSEAGISHSGSAAVTAVADVKPGVDYPPGFATLRQVSIDNGPHPYRTGLRGLASKASARTTIAVGAVLLILAAAASARYATHTAVSGKQPGGAPTTEFATVSKLINDAIAAHRLPGAVVVIGHGGKIVFRRAYGSRKLAGEPGLDGSPAPAEPMTEDTVFDVASLTKCLATATAVMQLYEQGKVAVRRSRAEVSA